MPDDPRQLPPMIIRGNEPVRIDEGRYRQRYSDGYYEEYDLRYDEEGKVRTKSTNPAMEFRRRRQQTMQDVKPLGTAPKAEGKWLDAAEKDIDAPVPSFERKEQIREFMKDPNVPEWRKTLVRKMTRMDI